MCNQTFKSKVIIQKTLHNNAQLYWHYIKKQGRGRRSSVWNTVLGNTVPLSVGVQQDHHCNRDSGWTRHDTHSNSHRSVGRVLPSDPTSLLRSRGHTWSKACWDEMSLESALNFSWHFAHLGKHNSCEMIKTTWQNIKAASSHRTYSTIAVHKTKVYLPANMSQYCNTTSKQ